MQRGIYLYTFLSASLSSHLTQSQLPGLYLFLIFRWQFSLSPFKLLHMFPSFQLVLHPLPFLHPVFTVFLSVHGFSSLVFSHTRGPNARPKEPSFQYDTVSDAKGGTGPDKAEAVGQRSSLHLGDWRGQVHAALLPHWLLALLREAQWRLVVETDTVICVWKSPVSLRWHLLIQVNFLGFQGKKEFHPVDWLRLPCIPNTSTHSTNRTYVFHAVPVCLSYLTCISVAATYMLARSSGSFV